MQTELTDIEKARIIIWQARHQECEEWEIVVNIVERQHPTPSTPVASLGRTKSQRRFRGWIMALMVACALSCCGVMGWAVFIAMRG